MNAVRNFVSILCAAWLLAVVSEAVDAQVIDATLVGPPGGNVRLGHFDDATVQWVVDQPMTTLKKGDTFEIHVRTTGVFDTALQAIDPIPDFTLSSGATTLGGCGVEGERCVRLRIACDATTCQLVGSAGASPDAHDTLEIVTNPGTANEGRRPIGQFWCVPEPASFLLLVAGAAMLSGARKSRV
jgi:hypothetical protein